MQRLVPASALLLAFLCSSTAARAATTQTQAWTMYQNGTTHNAVIANDFPAVSWTQNLHAKVNGGLAYDGQYLYTVDFDDDLVALDPQTGSIVWKAHADDVLMSTPIVAEGLVFVGSGTNALLRDGPSGTVWGRAGGNHWYAFRTRDGTQAWSYPTAGEAMPSAAYVDGNLLFATGDARATSVVAASAKPVWTTPLPGVPTMGSTMVRDGFAFFDTTLGKSQVASPARNHTLSLSVADGKVRWDVPYGNSDCTPTVAGGLVFVEGVTDGPTGPREAWGFNDVSALDERTGALRWHYQTPNGQFASIGSLERGITGTYDGGVLYQPVPLLNLMIAFRASDGRILWQTHTTGPVKMSPVVTGGKVYFGDTVGMLYTLDAKTGAVVGAIPFDRPYSTSPPVVIGATLFIADNDTIRAIPIGKL